MSLDLAPKEEELRLARGEADSVLLVAQEPSSLSLSSPTPSSITPTPYASLASFLLRRVELTLFPRLFLLYPLLPLLGFPLNPSSHYFPLIPLITDHSLSIPPQQQNGRLLGFIGILSALLQGGYVRRRKSTPSGPLGLAISGIYTCTISLLLLTLLPHLNPLGIASFSSAATFTLYTAAAGLAFVSATVVNSLNALASLETDGGGIDKGSALGKFRSSGQLGRALGPLVATAVYWIWGPSYCYAMGAAGSALVAVKMGALKRRGAAPAEKGKASKDL